MKRRALVLHGYSYAYALKDLDLEVVKDVHLFKKQPETFDLIMFTGGEDVTPAFYNHTSPKHLCGYSINRDKKEEKVYQIALKYGIKMTGICRGIQFINVMNGGTMVHHLNGHAGSVHSMSTANGEELYVNSLHHQMCVPSHDGLIVGWSSKNLSDIYIGDKDETFEYIGPEVESLIYPITNCAGVQYHPEMMKETSPGFIWYSKFVMDLLNMEMDSFVRKYMEKKDGLFNSNRL